MVLIFESSKEPSVGHPVWLVDLGTRANGIIDAKINANSWGVAFALFSKEIKRNSLGFDSIKVDKISIVDCNDPASNKLHPPWHNSSWLFVGESLHRSKSTYLIPAASCFWIVQNWFWFAATCGGSWIAREYELCVPQK